MDDSVPVGGWLDAGQQRAWLAFVRVQHRMNYEMNRQLQAESDLSLADYDVLTALSVAPGGVMAMTALAAQLGWERSRLSHHAKRMAGRDLVGLGPAAHDRRVTQVALADPGRRALERAAPGHVDTVRDLFFAGLDAADVTRLGTLLETVYANVLDHGSLPKPS